MTDKDKVSEWTHRAGITQAVGLDPRIGTVAYMQRFADIVENESERLIQASYEAMIHIAQVDLDAYKLGVQREREEVALLVEELGAQGLGTLAIAAAIRLRKPHA